MLLTHVTQTIKKNRLLESGDRVVVAVSGGPDSVALLYLLYELRNPYKLKLYIAHLNHHFRGKEADADARFVQSLAKKLNFPCYIKSIHVAALAKKEKKSLEEMARELRYTFLREIAEKKTATKIALGHTADDQVETILMWLLRGAGTEGLTGMPIARKSEVPSTKYQVPKDNKCKCKSQVYIIRPLLESYRKEILEYLKEKKQSYRQDKTNLKPIYLRNRIRNQLIPLLERKYNPNIKETLFRTAALLRDERDYFDSAATTILSCIWNRKRNDCFAIKLTEFNQLDRAIHRHIIRQAIHRVCGTLSGFGFEHIEAIIELANSAGDGLMLHLPHQITVRIEQDNLCFYLGRPKKMTIQLSYPISVRGVTNIKPLGLEVRTEIKKVGAYCYMSLLKENSVAFLDGDLIVVPLTLRTWQPGDAFIPLGMQGKKKLHDFFIDEKIPKTERDKIQLLVAGNGDILWVVGKRINEKYKITAATKRILRIQVKSF